MALEGLWLSIEIQSGNHFWQPKNEMKKPLQWSQKRRVLVTPSPFKPRSIAKIMATNVATVRWNQATLSISSAFGVTDNTPPVSMRKIVRVGVIY